MPDKVKASVSPQIHKRPLDAISVAPEFFIATAKETLKLVSASEMGEVPVYFGHTEETKRPIGTLYVIPDSKRRVAFPLLWDTEPKKFLFPQLFQALSGPDWASSFNATGDKNGTLHLDNKYLSETGGDVTDLPELIDAYIDERIPDKGVFILFRPLFSSLDRFRTLVVSGADKDETVTAFLRDLYGFAPSAAFSPGVMAEKSTVGVPEGYGVPPVKTAAASNVRYVAAPSKKDAKKKTRFYASYENAAKFKKEGDIMFRFRVEGSEPDWSTIKEVHSEAEDKVTLKAAAVDQQWLVDMASHEAMKMAGNLRTALTKGSQKVII